MHVLTRYAYACPFTQHPLYLARIHKERKSKDGACRIIAIKSDMLFLQGHSGVHSRPTHSAPLLICQLGK